MLVAAFEALRRAKGLHQLVRQQHQILSGIRDILNQDNGNGGSVFREQLDAYLGAWDTRAHTPKHATLGPFVDHLLKKTKSYAPGLFHCYDDRKIPRTVNGLESINGSGKRHLRKATGRKDTSGGEAQTAGPQMMQGVNLSRLLPQKDLRERLRPVPADAYRAARRRMNEQQAPARKYRSFQRNPQSFLKGVLERLDEGLAI
jgi:hypothetical protein